MTDRQFTVRGQIFKIDEETGNGVLVYPSGSVISESEAREMEVYDDLVAAEQKYQAKLDAEAAGTDPVEEEAKYQFVEDQPGEPESGPRPEIIVTVVSTTTDAGTASSSVPEVDVTPTDSGQFDPGAPVDSGTPATPETPVDETPVVTEPEAPAVPDAPVVTEPEAPVVDEPVVLPPAPEDPAPAVVDAPVTEPTFESPVDDVPVAADQPVTPDAPLVDVPVTSEVPAPDADPIAVVDETPVVTEPEAPVADVPAEQPVVDAPVVDAPVDVTPAPVVDDAPVTAEVPAAATTDETAPSA